MTFVYCSVCRLRKLTDKHRQHTSRDEDSDSEAKGQGRAGQGRAESMGRVDGGTGRGTGKGQVRAVPWGEQRRHKASAAAAAANAAAMKPDEGGGEQGHICLLVQAVWKSGQSLSMRMLLSLRSSACIRH